MYKTPIDICFYTVSSLYAFHAGIVKPSKEKVLRNSADEGFGEVRPIRSFCIQIGRKQLAAFTPNCIFMQAGLNI